MTTYVLPSSAVTTLLSHQTGLSVTPSTANAPVNIGTVISVTQNGVLHISIVAHVSASNGTIDFTVTRGATNIFFPGGSSTSIGSARSLANQAGLYSDNSVAGGVGGIDGTAAGIQGLAALGSSAVNAFPGKGFQIEVLSGDSIQFRASNNTGSDTTFLDDLLVLIS